MRRRKKEFRITKKGRVFITALLIIILSIPTFIFRFQIGAMIGVSKASINDPTHLSIDEINMSKDKIDFNETNVLNYAMPHKNPYIARADDKPKVEKETPKVDEDFFQKALFVGDSITEGIKDYGILDNLNVFAVKGLTISKAEKEIDSIVERNPERIYILLGSNDLLYGMDSDKFSSRYVEFIQMIGERLPKTKVYIQSIFPVSKDVETKRPMLSNSRIDEFNAKLKVTAEAKGIHYINISALLKDSNGIMNSEYTSDGIHVKYKFYNIWLDCIKKNSLNS